MSKAIVQMPDSQDKSLRTTRFVGPFQPASPSILALLMAIESGDEDAFHGVDPIDDPLLDLLTPAQISALYRSRMSIFDPALAAGFEAA